MRSVFRDKEEARQYVEQLIAEINFKVRLQNRDLILVEVGGRVKIINSDGLVIVGTTTLEQAFTTLLMIRDAFWVGVGRAERGEA